MLSLSKSKITITDITATMSVIVSASAGEWCESGVELQNDDGGADCRKLPHEVCVFFGLSLTSA